MASRYTFSPPERGIIVPSSSQTKSPQKESTNPKTQSISDTPADPTDPIIDEGVENIPVPMILPTLPTVVRRENGVRMEIKRYMIIVQSNIPKWRPIPPAVSSDTKIIMRDILQSHES